MKALLQKHTKAAAATLTLCATWLMFKTIAGVRAFQRARLTSTLAQLRDDQLKYIGISRSEIPQYAESLLTGDHNTV
jgi:uncharacterized protein YjiS (DUF1127 family)